MRCTARSKQTGEQCGQRALAGGSVCHWHGGKSPLAARKAAQRLAAAEARQAAAQTFVRHGEPMPENPLEALKALAGRFHAIEGDLFGRLAREPEQLAVLLPVWGAAAAKYLDVLTGWLRAEPPRSPEVRTIADLLDGMGEDWTPPAPRSLPPPAALNGGAPEPEPPADIERQAAALSASAPTIAEELAEEPRPAALHTGVTGLPPGWVTHEEREDQDEEDAWFDERQRRHDARRWEAVP